VLRGVWRVVACCHITTEPKRTPKRVPALCRSRSRRSQPPRQQSTWKGSEEPWACLCSAFASQHDDSSLLSPPRERDSSFSLPATRSDKPRSHERSCYRTPDPRAHVRIVATSPPTSIAPIFSSEDWSRGIMSAPQAPVKLRNGVVKQVSIRHRPLLHSWLSCYLSRVDTLLIPAPSW